MKSRTDETLSYVQLLARHFDKQDVAAVTQVILYDLDIIPGIDGYIYLRQAIIMYHAWSVEIAKKMVFPKISYPYDAGDSKDLVEQAIRRCIHIAWEARDIETWNLFFPPRRGKVRKCPANKEFIARISCLIELWQSCKEATYDESK